MTTTIGPASSSSLGPGATGSIDVVVNSAASLLTAGSYLYIDTSEQDTGYFLVTTGLTGASVGVYNISNSTANWSTDPAANVALVGPQGPLALPTSSTGATTGVVTYVPSDGDTAWKYNTGKSFVIDHPIKENNYLVHACLEGPEAGVYYRGKATIENGDAVTIQLPDYVNSLATNFTIQITPCYNKNKKCSSIYTSSDVENGEFTIYGEEGSVFWHVYGERLSMEVEPSKDDVIIKGEGPYKYICIE